MKDVRIPRQAQWQGHCQDWLGDVSTATQHKEKQECCNGGGEQRRKGTMVREGEQEGEWVKWGSVLLPSPLVRPVVEVRGKAALPQAAGIRLLQSSRHCTSLSPGCDLCSDAENPQRQCVLQLFTSAASRQPSLTSPADLPVNPQYRRPTGPSHATTCPLASFSPQHCSRAWEMLLRGTTYFPLFFPSWWSTEVVSRRFALPAVPELPASPRSALALVKQEEIRVPLTSRQQDVSGSA